MTKNLSPNDVAECISALVARNKLWAGKKVSLYFIVNKTAGCFTNKKKSVRYKAIFDNTLNEIKNQPECAASVSFQIFSTEYAGHAKDLTCSVVSQLIATDSDNSPNENLIVTAGGDGTSLEVQTALYKSAMEGPKHNNAIMNKITILRLPLGTGNDGTDGHTIEETIDLLKSGLVFANTRAIRVYPQKTISDEEYKAAAAKCGKKAEKYCDVNYKAPWYAFNIVSIGLDAYVVYMTNYIKKHLPGDLYQFCVPLSGLVYDKDFKTGTAKITLDNGEEIVTPITLMAFGASGNRVYGGGHKVLPDLNNLCIAQKHSLMTLIKENHRFADGTFMEKNLARLKSAEKIIIEYDQPILMQCDGETVMLTPEQFPLVMELTAPCLRVIQKI